MNGRKRLAIVSVAAGLSWLVFSAQPTIRGEALPTAPAAKVPLGLGADIRKYTIETPLKQVVRASSPAAAETPRSANSSVAPGAVKSHNSGQPPIRGEALPQAIAVKVPAALRLDRRKSDIETPLKQMVRASSPTPAEAPAAANPKVAPGGVHWHATFADACRASAGSGKPVLLFQMMGRLDQKFC